jgi:hypothetical protein
MLNAWMMARLHEIENVDGCIVVCQGCDLCSSLTMGGDGINLKTMDRNKSVPVTDQQNEDNLNCSFL